VLEPHGFRPRRMRMPDQRVHAAEPLTPHSSMRTEAPLVVPIEARLGELADHRVGVIALAQLRIVQLSTPTEALLVAPMDARLGEPGTRSGRVTGACTATITRSVVGSTEMSAVRPGYFA
jgi:hypothetical protein